MCIEMLGLDFSVSEELFISCEGGHNPGSHAIEFIDANRNGLPKV